MSLKTVCRARVSDRRELADSFTLVAILTAHSAPGLVFWFADNEAASKTSYPPSPFRWIDSQQEAEQVVEEAKATAATLS